MWYTVGKIKTESIFQMPAAVTGLPENCWKI